MKNVIRFAAMLALAGTCAVADQIVLEDGSVLKGKITEVYGGKLKITTGFAGDLVIDRAKVTSMKTDGPVMVALPTGKEQAVVDEKDGQAVVGEKKVAPAAITAIWKLGGVDPTLPPPPEGRKWSYELVASIDGKTGNTRKTTMGGGFTAKLAGPDDTLKLYLRGKYAKENHVKNEEEIVGGADYERMLESLKMSSWYIRTEAEHDKYENYKMYYTAAAGFSHYFLKDSDYLVRVRAGLAYSRKEYEDDTDTSDDIGVEFNYHHEIKIHKFLGFDEFGKLVTDITYTPVLDDWMNDYRIKHETAVDIPLGGSKIWAIRLGVSHDYNSRTGGDAKHLDTTYFGRLVLRWE